VQTVQTAYLCGLLWSSVPEVVRYFYGMIGPRFDFSIEKKGVFEEGDAATTEVVSTKPQLRK